MGTKEGTLLDGEQSVVGVEGTEGQQNNQQAQGANNQQEGSEQTPGWLAGVSKEYRDQLGDFATVSDFVAEGLKWKEAAEKPALPEKPRDDATAAEVEAYRTAMGIPVKSDDYSFEKSDLIGDDVETTLREAFLNANLTDDQAKAMHSLIVAKAQEGVDALQSSNKKARESAEEELKSQLQGDYQKTLEDAGKAFKRFATEEDREYFNSTGLGNDPGVIMMFARIQNAIGGDSLLSGPAGKLQPSEAKVRFPNSEMMH